MYLTFGIISASALAVLYLLRKIAIQNEAIEDLMNEAAWEKYHSEIVLNQYSELLLDFEILKDQYELFLEVQQNPLAN